MYIIGSKYQQDEIEKSYAITIAWRSKINFQKIFLFALNRIIFLLIILTFFSCNFLNPEYKNDFKDDKSVQLANTTWRLDYIQAEEGNVFPDYECNRWVPAEMGDYAYFLEFIGEDTITTNSNKFELRNACTRAFGKYRIIPKDSIQISWTEVGTPRGPHCERYLEFPGMVANSFCFSRQEDTLQLYVESFVGTQPLERSWAKSILFFSSVAINEN